jgi:hypothetical protein
MKIETQQDINAANGKFNYFHDGFIKKISVISDNEFLTDMPWEEQRQFASGEEELQAAGLCLMNETGVELEIHHHNYDWPNQPRKRAIIIRTSAAKMSDDLLCFIGREIFDLRFAKAADGVSCTLTHHAVDAGPIRSMENGITTVLFSSDTMNLEETEWAEPEGPGCGSQARRT